MVLFRSRKTVVDPGTPHEQTKAFIAAERHYSALPLLTEAISTDPKNPELHRDLGHVSLHLYRLGLAIVSFSNAIRFENGRDPRSYFGRACALRNLADFDAAILDYTTAIRLSPHDSLNYTFRAEVYRIKQEHELAITDCKKALKLDDKYPITYLVRGKAYFALGQYADAIADMETAFDLKEKPGRPLSSYCHWCA